MSFPYHANRLSSSSFTGTSGKRDAWASRYTSGVLPELGDERERSKSLYDDRATILARQKEAQATNLGLRLGLASSISRDLHSSLSSWPGSNEVFKPDRNTLNSTDFNPDISAADVNAASARGGNISFTFPEPTSGDNSAASHDGELDIMVDPDSSQLSRVVGSVIEPREKRERWHCAGCGLVFPRDSTIYALPKASPTASVEHSHNNLPDTVLREPDSDPSSYFCRPCYAARYKLGTCTECGGDILGTTRQDGLFVQVPTTGAMYHGRCFACVHCGISSAPHPLGDGASIIVGMHGLPLCEPCFDRDAQAPRRERPSCSRTSLSFDASQDTEGKVTHSKKDHRAKAVDELRQRIGQTSLAKRDTVRARPRPPPVQTDIYTSREEDVTPRPPSTPFTDATQPKPAQHDQLESTHSKHRPLTRTASRVRDVAAAFEAQTPKAESTTPIARTESYGFPSTSSSRLPSTVILPPTTVVGHRHSAQDVPTSTSSSSSVLFEDDKRQLFGIAATKPISTMGTSTSLSGHASSLDRSPRSSQLPRPNLRHSPASSSIRSDRSSLKSDSMTDVSIKPFTKETEPSRMDHAPMVNQGGASHPTPRISSRSSMGAETHSTTICARCGEPPFAGAQKGVEQSAMISAPGGVKLHGECFTCAICCLAIDGTKPFVRAPATGEDSNDVPAFAHPRCVPLHAVPIQRQVQAPPTRSSIAESTMRPDEHPTFQRTPKPASPSSFPSQPIKRNHPVSALLDRKPMTDSQSSLTNQTGTCNEKQRITGPPLSEQRSRSTAAAARTTRSTMRLGHSGSGTLRGNKSPPPDTTLKKSNPAAGFFSRSSALASSGKANFNSASITRPGAYGGMTPCPLCQGLLTSIEGVPGPRGTRWHKSCLVCRGTIPTTGKACAKRLDSGAKVDRDGRVLCRECFDWEARTERLQSTSRSAMATRLG